MKNVNRARPRRAATCKPLSREEMTRLRQLQKTPQYKFGCAQANVQCAMLLLQTIRRELRAFGRQVFVPAKPRAERSPRA